MAVVVVCTSCGKRLSIPEALYEKKVRGRVVSITCKVCGNPVKVDGTVPPPASGVPKAVEVPKSARVPRELAPEARVVECKMVSVTIGSIHNSSCGMRVDARLGPRRVARI